MAKKLAETIKMDGRSNGSAFHPLLILGGDLVYPMGSRAEYARRFVKPYSDAFDEVYGQLRHEDDGFRLNFVSIPG